MAAFEPSDNLRSRTFIGLILAQFLAAFNDQAIHASSMFFAIHKGILDKQTAISLMPVLFYAPWAIFCTLAGYLADRYSKRDSLVFWKVAEIGITLVALLGFWLGHGPGGSVWGPWIVLSAVFLMGTHSAFFVPAKYGAMPEILKPQKLSMGNGILESTSFLAVILGTVGGGILYFLFWRQVYIIGLILVGLAVAGAAASFLIQRMPAANPTRTFPSNPLKPLIENLRTLSRSRPLALAVVGVAFFTFMVAFMRATMYMHGETHHWDEFETSLVVATVALGVGLGSPLAGKLSGGKIELGLVPLGAVGMILATLVAAAVIFDVTALIATLILIGFFSGFYIVPLYTLLQLRAPKSSKGDLIATSNFVNVTGAIAASLLFFVLGHVAGAAGLSHPVPKEDVQENVASGRLSALERSTLGRVRYFEVQAADDGSEPYTVGRVLRRAPQAGFWRRTLNLLRGVFRKQDNPGDSIEVDRDVKKGDAVRVARYVVRHTRHYVVLPAGKLLAPPRDEALVPRFLFIGASIMTLAILLLLCRRLPDFFVRSLLWMRNLGKARARVVGLHNVPTDGPAILATNCDRFESCMSVVAATDRFTRFILLESAADPAPRPLLRYLARRTGLVALRPPRISAAERDKALASAVRSLREGTLLGVTAEGSDDPNQAEAFLRDLCAANDVPVLPVYCDAVVHPLANGESHGARIRVVIGPPMPLAADAVAVRHAIRMLGDWIGQTEHVGETPATVMIPGAAGASPPKPAAARPAPPSPA